MKNKLKAPYPFFGGKSKISSEVWRRLGNVTNFVEPFFGSGAILLANPNPSILREEIANDLNGFICNFYRSIKHNPEETAFWAFNTINETDLIARHTYINTNYKNLIVKLRDPDYFDTKIAGWWVWGMSSCIGNSWSNSNKKDKELLMQDIKSSDGINTITPRTTANQGINCLMPRMDHNVGTTLFSNVQLTNLFINLSNRFLRVKVLCGDWQRCLTTGVLNHNGIVGIFLDPPYLEDNNKIKYYYKDGDLNVAKEVEKWCIENGNNKQYRIVLCGYEDNYKLPDNWTTFKWKSNGGYSNQNKDINKVNNAHRETIWFSPHCLKPIKKMFD